MTSFELPEGLAKLAGRLVAAGFEEVRRVEGSMDTGAIVFARPPVEVALEKERSIWHGFTVNVQGWEDGPPFPLELGGDPFPPRPDRDPARRYPAEVRWLVRRLLGMGFVDESPDADDPHGIRLRRAPLTVELTGAGGWSGVVRIDAWAPAPAVELPVPP